MLIVLQWVGAVTLSTAALFALVLFSAAVVAVLEQETLATTVVAVVIAVALFLILAGLAIGAWSLLTAALGW